MCGNERYALRDVPFQVVIKMSVRNMECPNMSQKDEFKEGASSDLSMHDWQYHDHEIKESL